MRVALAAATLFLAAAVPALGATPPSELSTGKALFRASCGKCHTLQAAGTIARNPDGNGPTLTGLHLSAPKVLNMMATGSDVMPSFLGRLSSKQMSEIAAFVVSATKAK